MAYIDHAFLVKFNTKARAKRQFKFGWHLETFNFSRNATQFIEIIKYKIE